MYGNFSQRGLALRLAALAGAIGSSVFVVGQQPTTGSQNRNSPVQSVAKVSDAQVEADVLKALAGASDLVNQPITTTTVYGVVTLSGSVQTEEMRTKAENIVARTAGVQKVVDEMTLSGQTANMESAQAQAPASPEPDEEAQQQQSAPPSPQREGQNQPNGNRASMPNYPGAPEYSQRPYDQQQQPAPGYGQPGQNQPGYSYPQQPQANGAPGYGSYQQPYGNQPPYGQRPGYEPYPQPYGNQPYSSGPGYGQSQQPYYGPQQGPYSGQQAGIHVTVQNGALLRVRISQPLDSGRVQPGQRFDGVVINDVAADGAIAIPRGADVEGTVVDAQPSGALKGRGELSLQLTSVVLGGRVYPIVSDVWARHGGDKTAETVDKGAIGAGVGGIIGAAAGGGPGAAVGAGVGAAIGVGSSAASGNGQVYIPAEGQLTFHVTQPVTVATVSQMEMDRLTQTAGPARRGPPQVQRRYPPSVYAGPMYYYRPYYPYYDYYPRAYYRYPY